MIVALVALLTALALAILAVIITLRSDSRPDVAARVQAQRITAEQLMTPTGTTGPVTTVELVPCTACGQEVSNAAAACPRCGHPLTPTTGPRSVDNTAAWLLVAEPILFLVVERALVQSGVTIDSTLDFFVYIGLALAACGWDERLLARSGFKVSAGLLLIFIPVYLVQRTRVARQSYVIPAAWVVSFLLYVLGAPA